MVTEISNPTSAGVHLGNSLTEDTIRSSRERTITNLTFDLFEI